MTNVFTPDYAVHPGATLKESLDKREMSQSDLANRTGLSRKTINGIVNGKEPITHGTALQLEKVFRVPARFWVNLQSNYDEAIVRRRERSLLESRRNWVKERGIPYANLVKRCLVPDTRDPIGRLTGTLHFFGVSSPETFEAVWENCRRAYSFRQSEKIENDFGAVAAWLRQGELEAEKIECQSFDKERLKASLGEMRSMTLLPREEFQRDLVALCARCGIALVFVPGLKGAPIYGATRWIAPKKAIVELSLRGKDDGNLWFTFFHEIAHVLLHDKSAIFLELDKGESNGQEEEASEFARDLLIPARAFQTLIASPEFASARRSQPAFARTITGFAREIGVPPGVVVGRLQHDQIIPYSFCNDLKERFQFREENA